MAVDIDNPIKSAAVARGLTEQPDPCRVIEGLPFIRVQEDR